MTDTEETFGKGMKLERPHAFVPWCSCSRCRHIFPVWHQARQDEARGRIMKGWQSSLAARAQTPARVR